MWLGATVATLLAGRHLRADLDDAVRAALRLPSNLGDPAAWPSERAGARK